MTATAADLLTLLGALIVVIGGTSAYWLIRDRLDERAIRRLREQQMADELQRSVRQARIAADPTRPTNRYLTDTDGAPE